MRSHTGFNFTCILFLCTILLYAGGCRDALREGAMAGVSAGVAGLVESFLTSLTDPLLDGA